MLTLVSEMNTRMEVMVRELSEALERAQEEGRRNRFLGELGASIDLDEVLSRTLEAGGAIPGVDAAIVSIRDGAEKPIVATLGLSAEEAQRQVVSGPPNGHEARAISIVYQYPAGARGRRARALRPGGAGAGRDGGDRLHRDLQPLGEPSLRGGG